jgi:hypothetical protein
MDNQMDEMPMAQNQAADPVANAPVPEMNINPATPVQDDNFITVPEAEQVPDTITHLTNLITKIMDTDVDHEMIQKLAGSQINGATINLEESIVNGVEVMKCMIEINTVPANYAPPTEPIQQTHDSQPNNSDSDVVVISEPANFNKQKRKQVIYHEMLVQSEGAGGLQSRQKATRTKLVQVLWQSKGFSL